MDPAKRTMSLARRLGVLRPRDLEAHGVARTYLARLCAQGQLRQIGRGLYVPADAEQSADSNLAAVGKRFPAGVVCLLSALRVHGLTTQAPFEAWIALPRQARVPKSAGLPIRVVRMVPRSLEAGVEKKTVDGVQVSVFDVEKTVADCFRFRSRIGLDVALEAMREYLRRPRRNLEKLLRYAGVVRVQKAIRPYLEAML
ncbi:MAG: type IV toxin-antitoxin system AbiEi family antitoxin domain-containing protein [Planctomycetota bacterium]|jgi:predicted transcriptional regulator of viral defense system